MRLWVESACETVPASDATSADAVSTLSTEDRFVAAVFSGQESGIRRQGSGVRGQLVQRATANLASGVPMDGAVDDVLAALPVGEHVAIALLHVTRDGRASLAEIDAPPLFMARRGDFVLLPVTEEERADRLVRRCDFAVQAGDHLAMVGEDTIRARGGVRPWSWRDVAVYIRRLTATGCDAEQLAGALVRLAGSWKLEAGERQVVDSKSANQQISKSTIRNSQHLHLSRSAAQVQVSAMVVLALFVRPMRTATVWSGPPARREMDGAAFAQLIAEDGVRIICGDTTAEIAARLLGAELVMEPPPAEGWTEVPPVSRLAGSAERIDLITEGVVTLGVTRERLAQATRPRELAGREDGASRLAKLLLEADKIIFVVGAAINPAQIERDGTPLRKTAVGRLGEELKTRGKIVEMEYV
jgi:hypothetical protein